MQKRERGGDRDGTPRGWFGKKLGSGQDSPRARLKYAYKRLRATDSKGRTELGGKPRNLSQKEGSSGYRRNPPIGKMTKSAEIGRTTLERKWGRKLQEGQKKSAREVLQKGGERRIRGGDLRNLNYTCMRIEWGGEIKMGQAEPHGEKAYVNLMTDPNFEWRIRKTVESSTDLKRTEG